MVFELLRHGRPTLSLRSTEKYIKSNVGHCLLSKNTFTLRFTETATMYSWELTINGTIEGLTFNNFIYIRCEEAKDGSYSTMTVYDPEVSGILMTMSWHEQANVRIVKQ